MEVKAYLRSYQPALKYWELCTRRLDEAKEISLKSPKIDGMPRGGTSGGIEMQIDRILAAEKRLEKARDQALAILNGIEDMIESLDDFEMKTVLRLRYIDGLTWDEVAIHATWSTRTVRRIHGRALDELRRKEATHEHDARLHGIQREPDQADQ